MQLLRLGAQAALAASGKRKSGLPIMGAFVLGWGTGHWQPGHPQRHLLCYHHQSPVTSATAILRVRGACLPGPECVQSHMECAERGTPGPHIWEVKAECEQVRLPPASCQVHGVIDQEEFQLAGPGKGSLRCWHWSPMWRRTGFPHPEPMAGGPARLRARPAWARTGFGRRTGCSPQAQSAYLVPGPLGVLFLLSWDVHGDTRLGQASRCGRKQTLWAKYTGPRVRAGWVGGQKLQAWAQVSVLPLTQFVFLET